MCEDIAAEWKRRGFEMRNLLTGRVLETADDVWNYSSTGELYMIFEWYYSLFPERLPSYVENPFIGDVRYNHETKKVEMFYGMRDGKQQWIT